MTDDAIPPDDSPAADPPVPRLFLREPGWRVAQKVGSERTFCYATAPGQDHYHHIRDGELYVHRGDERLCLPCAARHGLLSFEPRPLREPLIPLGEFDVFSESPSDYDLKHP
jgi:hypothetical protein